MIGRFLDHFSNHWKTVAGCFVFIVLYRRGTYSLFMQKFLQSFLCVPSLLLLLSAGCQSPAGHRAEADRAAAEILARAQQEALGRERPLDIEPPADTLRRRLLLDQHLPLSDPASLSSREVPRIPQWPDPEYAADTEAGTHTPALELKLTLKDALCVAARSNRDYQSRKEAVFRTALQLDLQEEAFRSTWRGTLESIYSTDGGGDETVSGLENSAGLGLNKTWKTGQSLAVNLGVDLVTLLTQGGASSLGLMADATLSMPLLRGAGRFVVTEPLTQAQRNVVYALYDLERYKSILAVQVASDYLGVLLRIDQLENAKGNYDRLVIATRRARRLADAGRLPEIQVDQSRQDELRARNRWIAAQMACEKSLDDLKVRLGLPPDARLEIDEQEMERLFERARLLFPDEQDDALSDQEIVKVGPLEADPEKAIPLALAHRLDLRVRKGQIFDAQRSVAVAADQLRADADLLGRGQAGESRSLGSATSDDAELDLGVGSFSANLSIDLPFNRSDERVAYRNSLIAFESAVRDLQDLEDRIKLEVRNTLRTLAEARESVVIQSLSMRVAQRRLESTNMFLEAGRAEIRDVLEAEESLISAQNALSSALVGYRINELALQRDMGVLDINEEGLWQEYDPGTAGKEQP